MAAHECQRLSESDVFALLAHHRRRLTLRALRTSSPPLTTTELAERIAECERADVPEDRQRAVHVSIHHNHLPRLDDADAVRYDRRGRTVRLGPNFDRLADLLTDLDRAGRGRDD